jgi:hypothetical protein
MKIASYSRQTLIKLQVSSTDFRNKKTSIQIFMNIRPVGTEMINTDGRRHNEAIWLFFAKLRMRLMIKQIVNKYDKVDPLSSIMGREFLD